MTDVTQAVVEIYRVFPLDSSNPDPVVGHQVPTRLNSPSDNAFDSRDSSVGDAQFSVAFVNVTNPAFSAANSVLDGIHPKPGQTTGGEGAVDGKEVVVSLTFDPPFVLPAGHYFFVPQVALANGNFFWLSAATPGAGDLQSWIRNTPLSPDWLRVGTDIVGGGAAAPKFNGTFTLDGIQERVFQDNFEVIVP